MNPRHRELGRFIAELRRSAGLDNQADLATQLGVSQQTVSRWEKGTTRPSEDQLAEIAKALGAAVETLREFAGYGNATPLSFDVPFPFDRLDPERFERATEWLVSRMYPDADVTRSGSIGHTQDGDDVRAVLKDGTRIALQCKRAEAFGPRDVEKVVEKATRDVERRILVLSRVASPQTGEAVRHHPGWELWDKATLSRLIRTELSLADQARFVDIFFRGQRMALLGIPEPGAWLDPEQYFEPFEGEDSALDLTTPMHGQTAALDELKGLLTAEAETPVIVLSGQAGSGKSRLLREIVERVQPSRRVWFLSLAEEVTRKSLEELGDAPALLVIDDAHNRETLAIAVEHVVPPGSRHQLVIATRPYALDRIMSAVAAYRYAPPPVVTVEPLKAGDIEAILRDARPDGDRIEEVAPHIARVAGGLPLIALMIAKVMAEDGLSLEMAGGTRTVRHQVLSRFIRTLTQIGPVADQRDLRAVLDVLAVVQPFHIEDPQLLTLIATVCGIDDRFLPRLLKMLLEAGVIYQRSREYRLMPDLLSDHLIELACLAASGRLTAFGEAVIKAVPASLLGHALVNLGRMDWRIRDGDPGESRLLEQVWRQLETIDTPFDGRLEAVKDVAPYQPRQTLDLVRRLMRNPKVRGDLAPILRNVAYVAAHRNEACTLLWKLARDDERPTGPNPSHALRILGELAGYQIGKPLAVSRDVLDFGLGLMDDPASWETSQTPLDFLAPILSGEGMTTRSFSRHITLTPFFVSYDVVARLRARLIDAVMLQLETASGRKGYRLGLFLGDALRAPHGMMNAAPDDELMNRYRTEFVGTLERVLDLVSIQLLDDMTAVGIANGVSGRRKHGGDAVRGTAEAIFQALPQTATFGLRAALADGWGQVFAYDQGSVDKWQAATQAWLDTIAARARQEWPDPMARAIAVEEAIVDVRNAIRDAHGVYPLLGNLVANDVGFARAMLGLAEANPQAKLRGYMAIALSELARHEPEEARTLVSRFLASDERDLATAAAASLGDRRPLAEDDRALLREALRSPDDHVVSWAVQSVMGQRDFTEREVLDFTSIPRLPDAEIADRVAMLWTGLHHETVLNVATDEDARRFLDRIGHLDALKGHWLQTLISEFSARFPQLLLDWIFQRVEEAATRGSYQFQPIPYGPWVEVPLNFSGAQDVLGVQQRIWAWLSENAERTDPVFKSQAANVFEAIFLKGSGDTVAFLERVVDTATVAELRRIVDVLGGAGQLFIFEHRSFVIRLLNRAQAVDEEMFDRVFDRLWMSAITGSRGGTVGEPTEEDKAMLQGAEEALKVVPRTSPAWALYDNVRRDALKNMERSRREGEAWDD